MAHWREGSWALVVVLIAYKHDYKGLPGSRWPQMLSGQCLASDLLNHPKVMVLYWFHHLSCATLVDTFAFGVMSSARFAATG